MEEDRIVDEVLNRLAPEFREVLVLKDMEGQKYEAIAQKLRLPVDVVRRRLQQARAELRAILQREEE